MQFPIAEAFIEIEAANLMRYESGALFDKNKPCGAEANMARYLAAKLRGKLAMRAFNFMAVLVSLENITSIVNFAKRVSTKSLLFPRI